MTDDTSKATAPITAPANNPEAQAVANALNNALPSSLKGRAQMYAASGFGAVLLMLIQYFQPRYYPWLTPGMAETVAGLLGIGLTLALHELTRTAVFTKLKESFHAENA